ncbi:MAG: secretin N-terminal domain-containing protein [Pseudomonadota bacterium]
MIEISLDKRLIFLLLACLSACASQPEAHKGLSSELETAAVHTSAVAEKPSLELNSRLAWPESPDVVPEHAQEELYTFQATDLPLTQALRIFAKAHSLNMVVDNDVSGTISVDFQDLRFDQAMSALLDAHGFYWKRKRDLIRVGAVETRVFSIDYIRLVRSGSGSSQAQVSSGSDSASGEGGDDVAGTMTIQQSDKVDFWTELEEQLGVMVSEQGRIVTNRLAGTVQITDSHRRVEEVAQYIRQVNDAIYRQVDIEVKLVEVTLADDFSLGVDWSRLISPGNTGSHGDLSINNIVGQPIGGITSLPRTLNVTGVNISSDGDNLVTAVIDALKEQGEVRVVSQPRIRTLNNQSALIKVGTDRTFFRKEQLTDTTTAGSQIFSTDVPQVVTEGIVLAITPQISLDGWITLDVSPVITRVSSVSEVLDNQGNVQSTAPNLDISQASSLVRSRSGDTVVIGGLIQEQQIESVRSVPGLGRIPGVGELFKGRYKNWQKKELLMFVTPRIIDANTALTQLSVNH